MLRAHVVLSGNGASTLNPKGGVAEQVRTLSELGWFLTTGTLAQLFALVVVVVKLFMSPLQGTLATSASLESPS